MNGVGKEVGATAKVLGVIKDLPLWLLTGLAISAGLVLWIPASRTSLPAADRPWVILAGIVFGVLSAARATTVLIEKIPLWRASAEARKKFHITADSQQCHWSSAKQSDDSIVTQIAAHLFVKNCTMQPLALVRARLLRPKIRGEIVHQEVMVRAVDKNLYGTALRSGHLIPPAMALPISALIMIRGVPRRKLGSRVLTTIAIGDDEGHEQKVVIDMSVLPAVASGPAKRSLEMVSSVSDPIEREVASVLQSELARYKKCGRRVGGLGSIHLVIAGREITGVGYDSWIPSSPKNQSLYDKPEACELRSDNLEALLAFYRRLTPIEQQEFASALLDRMDGTSYLAVTYFVVCVLWKIGRLKEALGRAKVKLPQGETRDFGLSNTLMLINGLLRYRYPDFPNEMLDDIERFLDKLNEHTFQIPEKIAAIRTARLMG